MSSINKHRFRFYASFDQDAGRWTLDKEELHHLKKVLRLKDDEEFELFNGHGNYASALAGDVTAQGEISNAFDQVFEPEAKSYHDIALPALKPSDFDETLPALVELGVRRVHVFLQEGTDKKRLSDKVLSRWQRIVLQASKQCKRSWLPQVLAYRSLADFAAKMDAYDERFVFWPEGSSVKTASRSKVLTRLSVVGNESGLGEDQLEFFRNHNFTFVSCGPHVLRARTALVVAATAFLIQ